MGRKRVKKRKKSVCVEKKWEGENEKKKVCVECGCEKKRKKGK